MPETLPVDAVPALDSPLYTPGRGRPPAGHEKVDLAEALKLRLRKHWTYEEIANKFGVSTQYIHRVLTEFETLIPNPEVRSAFNEAKAEVLEGVQFRMISSLVDPAKMQKATLGNVAYAASKLDEMIRLERGQSTRNINVLSTIIEGAHSKLFNAPPQPIDSIDGQTPK